MVVKIASPRIAKILLLVSALLAVIGVLLLWHHKANAPAHTATTEQPSSIKPSTVDVDTYSVASDLPKYIEIPSIGVEKSRIYGLGTLKDGEIATPSNVHDTGWYTDSAKPGQPGTMFLFGHLSSWESEGVFYNLKKLKPGETITITRGDDKTYSYEVVKGASYAADQVDMNQVLSPVNGAEQSLTLMTCDGKLIQGTNDFTSRFVLYAS